jgi:hypothetical protein
MRSSSEIRFFRKNPISSLGRKLSITSHLVLLEEQLSLPVVDLVEDIRSRYLAFLSEAILRQRGGDEGDAGASGGAG